MNTSPEQPTDPAAQGDALPGPFRVADWQVNPVTGEIARGETRVSLEPKAAAVLLYLAQRPGDVVSRQELEAHVWQGRAVGYDAVTNTVIKLRKAFGDNARRPRIIETLPKRGYRLVAPLRPLDSPAADEDRIPAEPRRSDVRRRFPRAWMATILTVLAVVAVTLWFVDTLRSPSSDRPAGAAPHAVRIVVLPFENLNPDAEQNYFSHGLTEDLITALSAIPGLAVVANDSAFVYQGDAPLSRLRDELNVRYVLRGNVRREAERIRVNVRLIDAAQQQLLWAKRYEDKLADTFAVQDAIVRHIAVTLEVSIRDREGSALQARGQRGIEAYDHFLRGRERYARRTRQDLEAAKRQFEKAIALDPQFARAHASLALVHLRDVMDAWSDDPDAALQRAHAAAARATELNNALPEAHFVNAVVALFQRHYEGAVAELNRAVALRPSYADAYATLAWVLHFAGRPREGRAPLATAKELNPHVAASYLLIDGGIAFTLGETDKAISSLQRAMEISPTHPRILLWLAAAYARAGRIEDAQWVIQELRLLHPSIASSRLDDAFPFRDHQALETLKRALRKAGLTETSAKRDSAKGYTVAAKNKK
jgi:TolB-like protein/DNA-binding winged helix-turn-helix (wHTH) protein/Tfp pilus assembly protein PilF